MRRPSHYLLDEDHEPYPVEDVLAWARGMESCRRVELTELPNGYMVSTVFLGIDHNFGFGQGDAPLLFETMAFEGSDSSKEVGIQERYCTWAEAVAGHEVIVAQLAQWNPLPGILLH